jgi:hypothetical protein
LGSSDAAAECGADDDWRGRVWCGGGGQRRGRRVRRDFF